VIEVKGPLRTSCAVFSAVARGLANESAYGDLSVVRQHLQQNALTAGQFSSRWSVAPQGILEAVCLAQTVPTTLDRAKDGAPGALGLWTRALINNGLHIICRAANLVVAQDASTPLQSPIRGTLHCADREPAEWVSLICEDTTQEFRY
jgi:hypothetical protein